MRFSNPSPGNVSVLIDAPATVNVTLLGSGVAQTFDITAAVSIDIVAFWTVGLIKTGFLGFKYFAGLQLSWLDAGGNFIYADLVELANEGSGTLSAQSKVAVVRCPAVGASLQLSMLALPGMPLDVSDTMTVKLVLSARTTDRFRVTGQPGFGAAQAPDNGVLMAFAANAVLASGSTFVFFSTPFTGLVDMHFGSNVAMSFTLYYGAQSINTVAVAGVNGVSNATGLVETISLASGGFTTIQRIMNRTSFGIKAVNGATGGGNFNALWLKADN